MEKNKETIFNKLVRDNMLEIISNNNQEYLYHIATEEEYKEKLLEKLQEEVKEFILEKNEEELGDILEVLEQIILTFNFNKETVFNNKKLKSEKRGMFKRKIILEIVYDK